MSHDLSSRLRDWGFLGLIVSFALFEPGCQFVIGGNDSVCCSVPGTGAVGGYHQTDRAFCDQTKGTVVDNSFCSTNNAASRLVGQSECIKVASAGPNTQNDVVMELEFTRLNRSASGDSCLAHCPQGATNADCAAGKLNGTTSQSMSQLRNWVVSGTKATIASQELMSLFHVNGTDPCKRGPTQILPTGILNEGDGECTLTQVLDSPSVRMTLHVPPKIEANWDPQSSKTKLVFVGGELPSLHFLKVDKDEAAPLENDFGGNLEWLESDGTRFMVKTSKDSCVGVAKN